jgi:cell division protein ZapE
MPSRIRAAYDDRIAAGRLQPDPGQAAALKALERLERGLGKKGLFGARPEVRGLYLFGPPGRGKSILMDLFVAVAPEPKKTRAHFHAFMARVHDLIRQWREGDRKERQRVFGQSKGDDPIAPVAALIASEARLLCFDELQVTDIADAMLLGRLFEALFEQKVVLAVTSNRAPEELYKNGINRQLFTPFIDLIRERCEVVEVSGARDWRIDRMASSDGWFSGPDGAAAFDALWSDLKGDQPEAPCRFEVLGRQVEVKRTVGGLARATFAELCGTALGPQDYLAVAERFHTLFLEGVPVLDADRHHEARRLVTLIDALYEAGARLVVEADAPPEGLYPKGVGAFEFERTVSRLKQMTARDWLDRPRAED